MRRYASWSWLADGHASTPPRNAFGADGRAARRGRPSSAHPSLQRGASGRQRPSPRTRPSPRDGRSFGSRRHRRRLDRRCRRPSQRSAAEVAAAAAVATCPALAVTSQHQPHGMMLSSCPTTTASGPWRHATLRHDTRPPAQPPRARGGARLGRRRRRRAESPTVTAAVAVHYYPLHSRLRLASPTLHRHQRHYNPAPRPAQQPNRTTATQPPQPPPPLRLP